LNRNVNADFLFLIVGSRPKGFFVNGKKRAAETGELELAADWEKDIVKSRDQSLIKI